MEDYDEEVYFLLIQINSFHKLVKKKKKYYKI